MPHFKSRVMARSCSPSRIQAWVICTALRAQEPSSAALSIQACSLGRMAGRSMYRWLVVRRTGVVPHTPQRGSLRSTGSSSLPQFSHWSPRASA